jgi:hypothetical protein
MTAGMGAGSALPPGAASAALPAHNSLAVGLSTTVTVTLGGATENAQKQFSDSIQAYASRLAQECERQELSNRPSGLMYPEIAANSVVRACEVMDKFGTRAKPAFFDMAPLILLPVSSASVGFFGNYLHSTWQWIAFSVSILISLSSLARLAVRRLL